jgi:hypothetical protein
LEEFEVSWHRNLLCHTNDVSQNTMFVCYSLEVKAPFLKREEARMESWKSNQKYMNSLLMPKERKQDSDSLKESEDDQCEDSKSQKYDGKYTNQTQP